MLAFCLWLGGCAGSTLNRLPDGGFERQSRSTMEQQAADALRRGGASAEAREAQKRADKTLEEEQKRPVGAFFADLLYSLFGTVLEAKVSDKTVGR